MENMKTISILILSICLTGCLAVPYPHKNKQLTLSGQIINQSTGQPIKGIELEFYVQEEDKAFWATSKDNGDYIVKSDGEQAYFYWIPILPFHSMTMKHATISRTDKKYKVLNQSQEIEVWSYLLGVGHDAYLEKDIYIKLR